jgi:hypothetical protein
MCCERLLSSNQGNVQSITISSQIYQEKAVCGIHKSIWLKVQKSTHKSPVKINT